MDDKERHDQIRSKFGEEAARAAARHHSRMGHFPEDSFFTPFIPTPLVDLTPEERKVIGTHERLHLDIVDLASHGKVPVEHRARALAVIVAFENGETDSPFLPIEPSALSKWLDLAVDLAIAGLPIPPSPGAKKYFVHWGYMQQHTDEFTDFEEALAYFAANNTGPSRARLVGEGADADCDEDGFHQVSDGLTEEERDRLEEVSNGAPP